MTMPRITALNPLITPRRATTLAACSAALLAMSACENQGPRPPAGAQPDVVAQGGAYPKITLDGSLAQYMVIDYTRIIVDAPGGTQALAVQTPARSQADNDMTIQYNYTWFDTAGHTVGETGWRTVTLPSRRQMMLSGTSTTAAAVDWRMDIRSAR